MGSRSSQKQQDISTVETTNVDRRIAAEGSVIAQEGSAITQNFVDPGAFNLAELTLQGAGDAYGKLLDATKGIFGNVIKSVDRANQNLSAAATGAKISGAEFTETTKAIGVGLGILAVLGLGIAFITRKAR